jgi:hypothetical protein
MPVRLSLCLIAKNEAAHLPRCLASVRGLVDEMVVVDTGSTDATPNIAAGFGARVFAFPWCDDFAAARNFGLDQARGEWLLVLDADEALDPVTAPGLQPLLETASAAVEVWVRNFQPPDGVAYTDARSVRLFRNRPEFRYQGRIHEQIVPALRRAGGRLAPSDLVICHYGYVRATVQGQASRLERNLRLLENAVAAEPADAYLCAKLGLTCVVNGQAHLAARHLRRALDLKTRRPSALNDQTAARVRSALEVLERDQAAQTLQGLLAADDLPAELERRRPELSQALWQLVQASAHRARAEGEAELAAGLATLADHIAAALAAPVA